MGVFTNLLEVVIRKNNISRTLVKLVRCDSNNGSSMYLQVGRWKNGIASTIYMVSLNSEEVEFVIEAIPKLLETSPRTLELLTKHRNLYLTNNGSRIEMNRETIDGFRKVSFLHSDVHYILSVLQGLRFFQAPGEQTADWVDNVLWNVFLQLVEKDMKGEWLDYQEALKRVYGKKAEFMEQVAKVMPLFNFPVPDNFFLENEWTKIYKRAILENDLNYNKESGLAVYQPIKFILETDLELFFNSF
jgi:hypothetical protein